MNTKGNYFFNLSLSSDLSKFISKVKCRKKCGKKLDNEFSAMHPEIRYQNKLVHVRFV